MSAEYFVLWARNNAVANHRLLSACLALEPGEFTAPRTGFFPSLAQTLNHNLTVDWFYVDALEGGSLGYRAFDPEIPFTAAADVMREQRAVDLRLLGFCQLLDDAGLGRIVTVHRDAGLQKERLDRLLMMLFQHQIHHRGQAQPCYPARRSSRHSLTSSSPTWTAPCARRTLPRWAGARKSCGSSCGSSFATTSPLGDAE